MVNCLTLHFTFDNTIALYVYELLQSQCVKWLRGSLDKVLDCECTDRFTAVDGGSIPVTADFISMFIFLTYATMETCIILG